MTGAAILIQGYVARDGLGMTLTKNHSVERQPVTINNNLADNLYCFNQVMSLPILLFMLEN